MGALDDAFYSLIPIAFFLGVFSFLSVAVWVRHRRREREAYYRHELLKQMIARGEDAERVMALMERSQPPATHTGREASRLGGLVLLAVGIGLMIALQWVAPDVWGVGAIPTALGIALLIYAFTTRPPANERAPE